MMKLISIDVKSDFGFFRKPETNNTLNVSYNMIHKPAIWGLLGAVIGLKGYQEKGKLPEYYNKLSDLKIGIAPLNHENGNFSKTSIKYSNTVGYANKGTTFLTEELTLIAPQYRIYLLLDKEVEEQKQLLWNLKNGHTEFIPYFGKNEFTAWWDNYQEYEYEVAQLNEEDKIRIDTLFVKNQTLSENSEEPSAELDFLDFGLDNFNEPPFMYFERLPIGFNLQLMQYELTEMVYSNYKIKNVRSMPNIFYLTKENSYVQLI
ncbi:type I-B CRISPR-associated protein Cas5 [Flavobacteriaceae bacterium Ap0902]|nr:type I-B CRISPR-associated protein Cas5 [Flavobacteriaceae bacterium Ap0902]